MFTEHERAIYSCPHTGRRYDPLALKRTLVGACHGAERYNALVASAVSEDTDTRDAAIGSLIAGARVAFALPAAPPGSVTESSMLDAVVYDALIAFSRWLSGKGERGQKSPSSAPCSDCP